MLIVKWIFNLKQSIHNSVQLIRVDKGIGNNVFGKISIINPRNLKIGNGCSFNHYVYINAFCPIVLGDDVTVSAGAKIISTGIDYLSWKNGKKRHNDNGNIYIGSHVWIGAGAQILSGVKITGEYVVIAAGAIVDKDIEESNCIVAGVPAKIIKSFN